MQSPVYVTVHNIAICQSGKSSGILTCNDGGIGVVLLIVTASCISDNTSGCRRRLDLRILAEGVIDISKALGTGILVIAAHQSAYITGHIRTNL